MSKGQVRSSLMCKGLVFLNRASVLSKKTILKIQNSIGNSFELNSNPHLLKLCSAHFFLLNLIIKKHSCHMSLLPPIHIRKNCTTHIDNLYANAGSTKFNLGRRALIANKVWSSNCRLKLSYSYVSPQSTNPTAPQNIANGGLFAALCFYQNSFELIRCIHFLLLPN